VLPSDALLIDDLLIDALLLDFDGTIVDTERTVLAAWRAEYAAHGLVLDERIWRSTVGGVSDQYAVLAELVGPGFDLPAVRASVHRRESALVRDLPARAGVRECIHRARAVGLRLAVVSSSPAYWVTGHLDRLGLRPAFDTVVTRESAVTPKPAPDLYLEALDRLAVAPTRALVVEDAANGVTAARAAGLRCQAFPNEVTVHQDLSHADEVLPLGTTELWDAVQRLALLENDT
jgi:HAD superfamily hydrolase (TIGR01509 family)